MILSVDTLPTFGFITDIIMINATDYYLVAKVARTVCFVSHYHAYEIEVEELHVCYTFVKPMDLIDHNVLGLYKKKKNYVVLKYAIPSHL